jgi:hypothetical protein
MRVCGEDFNSRGLEFLIWRTYPAHKLSKLATYVCHGMIEGFGAVDSAQ